MISYSAIVVVALCLVHAVHSRGLNTGGLCAEGEFQCGGKSECIKLFQICDNTTDCIDGSDESGCDCLKNGQLACEVQGKCIQKEQFCKGDPCPNMKGNVTCSEVLQGAASEISESTANNTTNNTTMEKANMTLSDNKVNMTMDNQMTNVTTDSKMANMTMEDKNVNTTMEDKNVNTTMGDKMTNMTMDDKMVNMTMNDNMNNMTMDKNASMIRSDQMTNVAMSDKLANATMDDKKVNMTMNDNMANKTVKDSASFNATINEPVESKNNMTVNNSTMASPGINKSAEKSDVSTKSGATTMELKNRTMNAIVFENDNSTENSWNSTEFNTTTMSEPIDAGFLKDSNITMEGDIVEVNDTSNNDTEACNMSGSITCEEFDPPCISAIEYCNHSVPCPSQNWSNVCGEDNVPLPNRKGKLANLVNHYEPDEQNFINGTNEVGSEDHATKESLKVTESEKEGNNHLKIIIPVAVIGGLCLVAIIIWFVTRRNKNVDSYALQ